MRRIGRRARRDAAVAGATSEADDDKEEEDEGEVETEEDCGCFAASIEEVGYEMGRKTRAARAVMVEVGNECRESLDDVDDADDVEDDEDEDEDEDDLVAFGPKRIPWIVSSTLSTSGT